MPLRHSRGCHPLVLLCSLVIRRKGRAAVLLHQSRGCHPLMLLRSGATDVVIRLKCRAAVLLHQIRLK